MQNSQENKTRDFREILLAGRPPTFAFQVFLRRVYWKLMKDVSSGTDSMLLGRTQDFFSRLGGEKSPLP